MASTKEVPLILALVFLLLQETYMPLIAELWQSALPNSDEETATSFLWFLSFTVEKPVKCFSAIFKRAPKTICGPIQQWFIKKAALLNLIPHNSLCTLYSL